MLIKNENRAKKQEPRILTSGNLNLLVLTLGSCLFSLEAFSQCAMCRAALEGEGNSAKAEAVNDGIVYLMAIPYLLVGVIGYYIYRTQLSKKKKWLF